MIKYLIILFGVIGLVLSFDSLFQSIGDILILASIFGAMWYINQKRYE